MSKLSQDAVDLIIEASMIAGERGEGVVDVPDFIEALKRRETEG